MHQVPVKQGPAQMHDHDPSPFNPLPPVVVALFLMIAGVEAALSLADRGLIGGAGGVGWRLTALNDYAFSAEWMDLMVQRGLWQPAELARLVTYPFVQGNFTQALFVSVFLLALGKMVGEVFHPAALVAVFVVSGVAGALLYWLVAPEARWLIGGFPPVYGLIGAFSYLMWLRLGELGDRQIMAFQLFGVLMGIQLLFGLLFGGTSDWVADVGGFFAGFALSAVVAPGGWRAIVTRLRRR
jgi:membrane associated rhomboid family serine protease